jgi:hypothetical protein
MKPAREIDRICDEFEAAWLAGEVPIVEEFVARIDDEHRPALREALMPLDLTYRGKLSETLDSGAAADEGKVGSGGGRHARPRSHRAHKQVGTKTSAKQN